MLPAPPHFLLQVDAVFPQSDSGEWRFVLTDQLTGQITAASDAEPDLDTDRLALLGLVRGLEAIPRPSRVTLLTSCRGLRDGLRDGLASWKSNGWKWERFGRLVTIRNVDLWRRVDSALQIHQLRCRSWRVCVANHTQPTSPAPATTPAEAAVAVGETAPSFAPNSAGPASFLRDPALLVIRKPAKRNRLRIDHSPAAGREFAHASAG